ncbi:hypothetical protein ACFU7T_14305 [Streptomyces sp. NPDC057555]|uniref:hypothetical protein n=1 Tax=Streptomyces sp. NPDC057555 TaxID=3346166 RepID=UPI0036830EED
MLKLGKTKRAVALGAAALALAGSATFGLGGTAQASVGAPDPAATDHFSLYLTNNSGGRQFLVCNHQSSSNTVFVGVQKYYSWGSHNVELQDVNTGWTTYGANISFNRGACEEFNIIGADGQSLMGYILTPNQYDTGWVTYN